ncbi:amidohydrolase family protein [Alteribacillus sp. HJP-4]|uniref:N-acyl-D-amino-acid deacylase family protein n=1 Tax=Alteribacillus sp. HJP-4 TaxID=2775394 RepID=UPI0035CCCB88
MLDVIIKNGKIADGTGNPWYKGDVGIKDGMITHTGYVDAESRETIDAQMQVISPGFIDGHSHSDLLLLNDPQSDIKLQQGVTTEVVGNCGLAPAPYVQEHGSLLKDYVKPVIGDTPGGWPWSSVEEYMQELHKAKISENVSTYVAHGSLRIAVMGFENRPASSDEIAQMKELLEEGLQAGAIGLSIGLLYSPGRYSSKEELAELCTVLPKYNGLLATHIRGEGNNLIASIKEVLWIAQTCEINLHVSHLKAAGKRNWGAVNHALQLIEDARAKGLTVTCDVYPYHAGSTMLTTVLPPWTLEGGTGKCLERLKNTEVRNQIKNELQEEQEDWDNLVVSTGWENVVISSVSDKNISLEGKSVLGIAEARGQHPIDTAFDLLIEENGNVGIVYFHMAENDVRDVIKSDFSLIISDSLGCETGKPHPRLYGTYPRLFEHYVRENKILRLEDAIRKVTSFPAQKFKLGKRGLLTPGYCADITIFDPETIKATATFEQPINYPEGIHTVFVNGVKTIAGGQNLRTSSGQVIPFHHSHTCDHH